MEMVLVLFLVGLMASATLMLTEGVEDQAKYDETKRRMNVIRKAIVGDPTRTINGGPEISGFVADMGRLPLCIAELLELGDEITPATDPKTYESPCDDSITISAWAIDATVGVGYGWRGSYISVLPEGDGVLRFRDGYGNSDALGSSMPNFGWSYAIIADALGGDETRVDLNSNGFNSTDATGDISASQLVVKDDWQISSITVNFINQNANSKPDSEVKLILRIYNSETEYVDGDSVTLAQDAIPAGGQRQETFNFDGSNGVAIGTRAYALVCYEEFSDADDYEVYDGDCVSGNGETSSANIRALTIAPRQSFTVEWITP
ncbi:MAG: hypothetical protein methR_P0267 [Methyloprofundus sp.]|nr:MAG: hypothetical protein methR_P0267 [Methyloprofundus sp.]